MVNKGIAENGQATTDHNQVRKEATRKGNSQKKNDGSKSEARAVSNLRGSARIPHLRHIAPANKPDTLPIRYFM